MTSTATATTTAAAHDVGVGVIVVTVLGFGNRAPTSVVNFLVRQQQQLSAATAATGGGDRLVQLQRSPGLLLPLLQQGIFATEDVVDSTETTKSADHHLIVYCIPTSVSEYLLFSTTEVAHVRSVLVESLTLTGSRGGRSVNTTKTTTVVVGYDATKDQFVGINVGGQDGRNSIDEQLSSRDASASGAVLLQALAALEAQAANQLVLASSKQGDTVLVVGSGGREHAIAVALAQSPLVSTVLCCPGNGGTQLEASSGATSSSSSSKIVNVGTGQDNTTVLDLLKLYQDDPNKHSVNMVVVGPEAPLVDGLVDAIHEQFPQVLVFGPTAAAAQLEASKAFSKDFLHDIGVPTATYKTFTDMEQALAYVESLDDNDRQVVKASGLAAGKGVLLPTTKAETLQAVREIMNDKAFGAAGDTIVIEQFLDGPEASCLAFCDGQTAKLMPAAQDHKRALDNDQGLNTGGMGAYAPAPCVTPALHQVIEEYCQRTVQHMAARGTPYIGVLYAGMMLTPNGPYVLEFNCRFGDPETQVLLPLLETDLYEVMMACCKGTLNQVDVRFTSGLCAATVVCAAAGYPEAYPKGMQITGLEEANAVENVKVYHAGTVVAQEEDAIVARCSGGRVLAVTGCGPSLQAALKAAYQGVSHLDFVDPSVKSSLMHHRTDIGRKAVDKKLRIGVMGSTRGSALVPVMDACSNGSLDAEIVAVLSNKSSAPILDKGRSLGATVTTKFLSSKGLTRAQYDAMCTSELIRAGVDYVLLVGYMRILSKEFCDYWSGKCVNVHPSLLPLHAGGMDLEVHKAVIDAKETESGCTIHLVTEAVDGGPILVQKRVAVDPGDTPESLKAKVQPLEGPAFVEAIQQHIRQQKDVGGGGAIRYVDAGVSIDAGNQLVDMIKPLCKATRRPGCDADLGGFGGLFDLSAAGFDASDTVLIGATDGVGTKLKVAQLVGKHETVGIDLVAMCVNDLIVAGGEPLFFLDYFATGHLEVHEAASVVKGIAEGCLQAGCGLIGGETAEMPSMYAPGEYDLAGFSVGAVSRNAILPRDVSSGDVLLGIASSGLHSNGFSLVRKLVEKQGLSYESPCPWDSSFATVGDALLVPTQIYVEHCLPLLQTGLVKGMAHITGGGLLENLPRSMPKDLDAQIQFHPPLPPVFRWMKDASGLDDTEMLRTFNCGIGMVVIVSPDVKDKALDMLKSAGGGDVNVYELGHLVSGGSNRVVMLQSLN